MNKIKTTRGFLSAVIVAAALGLVACGGGDSGPSSLLSSGAVGTKGDYVNLAEYEAIKGGMTMDQVKAIVADAPTGTGSAYLGWSFGGVDVGVIFENGGVKRKVMATGGKEVDSVVF
jgi:hypothetical protein